MGRLALSLLPLAGASALLACSDERGPPTSSERDAASPTAVRDAGAEADGRLDAGSGTTPGLLDANIADSRAPEASDAGTSGQTVRRSLVLHELWTQLAPTDDPFDDRAPDASCARTGVMPETLSEERVFSVDTGLCNYLTVTQPTLSEVAAGETLKVRLWHFELTAPEPAEAHAAVFVDGLPVLDERVTIPGLGGLLSKEIRVPRAIPRGAPVHFHLHNHGINSWSLVEVSARP